MHVNIKRTDDPLLFEEKTMHGGEIHVQVRCSYGQGCDVKGMFVATHYKK